MKLNPVTFGQLDGVSALTLKDSPLSSNIMADVHPHFSEQVVLAVTAGGDVYMDGNKVGKSLTIASSGIG